MSERQDREFARIAGAAQFAAAAVVAWALRPAADALAERLIGDDRLHNPRARAAIASRDARIAALEAQRDDAQGKAAESEGRAKTALEDLGAAREQLRATEQKREELAERAERLPDLEHRLGQQSGEIKQAERDLEEARLARREAEKELESLRDELHKERVKSETFRAAMAGERAPARPDGDEIAAPAEYSFIGVVQLARQVLDRLAIPDSAIEDVEALDRATNAAVRAEDTWKALRALHEYATEAEFFNGSFYNWCEHSHSPHVLPTLKVAMTESDTVQNTGPLRANRLFKVDREVNQDGKMHMFAHLKPVEGGGEDIPRVYFHDDTGGRTGKVHVGAIARHVLFPNKKS